jgi:hypothetical protein
MAPVPAYQYASRAYSTLFPDQADADKRWGASDVLRASCLDYLKTFNERAWYDEPVVSILGGRKLEGGKRQKTLDAFGVENGSQVIATDEQADLILHHVRHYKAPKTDYLSEFEKIDNSVLSLPLAAEIMGNQMVDYRKQDGITEVIEAQGANSVERRLNAALLEDEKAGNVQIIRWPAFIGCVSNFSNFLDLSRKVMRNMELGVPVVVLSRNNTTQHMFRWTLILLEMMRKEQVDLGLLTFFSCSRQQKTKLFSACPECPAYFTCSREVAEDVKKMLPKIMSSTGGPNTLVATSLTPEVSTAIRLSGMIENKGQCTAMRHFVLPGCTEKTVDDIFAPTPVVQTPLQSLQDGIFAGIFEGVNDREVASGYKRLPSQPMIHFRMADTPRNNIEECWREPVIDVTAPLEKDFKSEQFVLNLCHWLNAEQPISLAVNGDDELAMTLFERSGLVVYSVGTLEKPALTAQARPEDGECFGEFPPRSQLQTFTHLPVIIPSSTPGYNTEYTHDGLLRAAVSPYPPGLQYCEKAFGDRSVIVVGFVKLLCEYLVDACGPKRGVGCGGRTSLYGLQRPPLLEDCPTVLRIDDDASLDSALSYIVPFFVTNARCQLQVSVGPATKTSLELANFDGLSIVTEDVVGFEARLATFKPYNVITVTRETTLEPILAMHWVSRFFPMGHIKSVKTKDEAFVQKFTSSRKWLAVISQNSKL